MHRVPAALRQIVRADRHLTVRPDFCVVLREKNAAATLTHVNIDCRGCEHVFAFTLDHHNHHGQPIALSEHTSKAVNTRWNKVCDGILVWRDTASSCWKVLLCDLKSYTPHGSDWKDQHWSTACFVEYLFAILRRYYPNSPTPAPLHIHAVTFCGVKTLSGRGKRSTGLRLGAGFPSTSLAAPARISVRNRSYLPLRALCQ